MRNFKLFSALLLLSGATFFFFSCGTKKVGVADLSWMTGNWQGVTPEGRTIYENWVKDNTGALLGQTYGLSPEGDTTFKDVLKVEQFGDTAYYITSIPGQQGAVHYKLLSLVKNSAVFENKTVEFPSQTIYTLEKPGVLNVQRLGVFNGKNAKQELTFQLIK